MRSLQFAHSEHQEPSGPVVWRLCAKFSPGTDGLWGSDKADAVRGETACPSGPAPSLGAFARKSHVSLFPEGTEAFVRAACRWSW